MPGTMLLSGDRDIMNKEKQRTLPILSLCFTEKVKQASIEIYIILCLSKCYERKRGKQKITIVSKRRPSYRDNITKRKYDA